MYALFCMELCFDWSTHTSRRSFQFEAYALVIVTWRRDKQMESKQNAIASSMTEARASYPN